MKNNNNSGSVITVRNRVKRKSIYLFIYFYKRGMKNLRTAQRGRGGASTAQKDKAAAAKGQALLDTFHSPVSWEEATRVRSWFRIDSSTRVPPFTSCRCWQCVHTVQREGEKDPKKEKEIRERERESENRAVSDNVSSFHPLMIATCLSPLSSSLPQSNTPPTCQAHFRHSRGVGGKKERSHTLSLSLSQTRPDGQFTIALRAPTFPASILFDSILPTPSPWEKSELTLWIFLFGTFFVPWQSGKNVGKAESAEQT